jgi:hypothetical protein
MIVPVPIGARRLRARTAEWRTPSSNTEADRDRLGHSKPRHHIMNDRMRSQFDTVRSVAQFGKDHPLVPSNAVATAAVAAVDTAIADIETLHANRLNGTNALRGATGERRLLRAQLRSAVSDLSRVSKTLDQTLHPDIASHLKIGALNSYAALLAFARNVITVVTPIKQVFIDRGAPTTVIEDLQALIDASLAAEGRSHTGRGTQICRNTELKVAIRAAMHQVRVLDAIMNLVLKPTPGLLAEWQSAKRIRRSPRPSKSKQATSIATPTDGHHQSTHTDITALATNPISEHETLPPLPATSLRASMDHVEPPHTPSPAPKSASSSLADSEEDSTSTRDDALPSFPNSDGHRSCNASFRTAARGTSP